MSTAMTEAESALGKQLQAVTASNSALEKAAKAVEQETITVRPLAIARAAIRAYLSHEALADKATKAVARLQDNDMRDEPSAEEIARAVLSALMEGVEG